MVLEPHSTFGFSLLLSGSDCPLCSVLFLVDSLTSLSCIYAAFCSGGRRHLLAPPGKDEKCYFCMLFLRMISIVGLFRCFVFFYNISFDFAPFETCFHADFGICWSFLSIIANYPRNTCQNRPISWTFFRYIVESPTFRFAMCQKQAFRLADRPADLTFPLNPSKVQLLPRSQARKKR